MFDQVYILLKMRKKQIIIGIFSSLLVSSFFTQLYIQTYLANPVIAGYLKSMVFSDPSIRMSGSYSYNAYENFSMISIENESLEIIQNAHLDFVRAVNNVAFWAQPRSYHYTTFHFEQNDSELDHLSFRAFSRKNFDRLLEITIKDYTTQQNFTYNSTIVNYDFANLLNPPNSR